MARDGRLAANGVPGASGFHKQGAPAGSKLGCEVFAQDASVLSWLPTRQLEGT